MEIRQVSYFLAVVDESSFTRAAARMHVAQSALSAGVRALERELGAELFWRTTRQVRLSDAGEAFEPAARDVVAAVAAAEDAVARRTGRLHGHLRVGILQTMGSLPFSERVARFHEQHPYVQLDLRTLPTPAMLDAVSGGELDLGFASAPETADARDVELIPLVADRTALFCPAGHRFAGRRRVAMRELDGERFVDLPSDWGIRRVVDKRLDAAGVRRSVTFEVGDVTLVLDMVGHGLGLALLHAQPGGVVPESVREVPLLDPPLRVVAAALPKRHARAAARALVDQFLA